MHVHGVSLYHVPKMHVCMCACVHACEHVSLYHVPEMIHYMQAHAHMHAHMHVHSCAYAHACMQCCEPLAYARRAPLCLLDGGDLRSDLGSDLGRYPGKDGCRDCRARIWKRRDMRHHPLEPLISGASTIQCASRVSCSSSYSSATGNDSIGGGSSSMGASRSWVQPSTGPAAVAPARASGQRVMRV